MVNLVSTLKVTFYLHSRVTITIDIQYSPFKRMHKGYAFFLPNTKVVLLSDKSHKKQIPMTVIAIMLITTGEFCCVML